MVKEKTITDRIRELREMTLAELRGEYEKVFGEPTNSRHKEYLWKRIAWRIQELEYGGLSERAQARAKELADEALIRVRPPRNAFDEAGRPRRAHVPPGRDRRLPMPGTVLTREYKGREFNVKILERGFEYDGLFFRSLSAAARAVTGTNWNGYQFWGLAVDKEAAS